MRRGERHGWQIRRQSGTDYRWRERTRAYGGDDVCPGGRQNSAEGRRKEVPRTWSRRRCGRLDILYNNAGIVGKGRDTDVANLDVDAWNQVIQVNLGGIFLSSKYAVPALVAAGGGSIINTASVAGMIGSPNSGHAYAASKGGVIALTRAMAVKYAPHKIRVNAICPGTIHTPMTDHLLEDQERLQVIEAQHPLGYLGTPEDIVHLAIYMASDESSWVTGGIFPVDGGRTAQ